MNLKFLGAAREVTGSKILLTTDSGKRILFDCGMFQGKGLETDAMNRDLGFDPSLIDHIILTSKFLKRHFIVITCGCPHIPFLLS